MEKYFLAGHKHTRYTYELYINDNGVGKDIGREITVSIQVSSLMEHAVIIGYARGNDYQTYAGPMIYPIKI